MNLIQIQENLKDLPTQAIMGYANGANPEVPPYMALSELNRRKAMEQRSAQQPTQSVKDQLEAQVSNPPQAPQLPQGPQGIAQLPGAQGMPQAPQAGQGMPQMPQGMPQGAPQGMAGGGLAGLEVPDDMFHYAPGGIVAFAGGEQVLPEDMYGGGDSSEGEAEAKAKINELLQGPPAPAPLSMEDLARSIVRKQMMGENSIPEVTSPAQAREEAIKQRPELAPILNSLPGGALTGLIGKLKERDQATQERSKENEGRLGLAGLSNALISAAEATRGHKGMALGEAFGGFGKSYGKYTEEAVKRSEAQQALQRQYEIETAKLQSDVDSLQRAYANNDVANIMTYKNAVSERQAKLNSLQTSAANAGYEIFNKDRTYDLTKSHNKATETQAQASLAAQIAHYADQKAGRIAQQANSAEALRVQKEIRQDAIDQRARGRLDEALGRDPRVQILSKKLLDRDNPVEIGSDQYNLIMDEIAKIRSQIIAEHPDFEIPDASGKAQYAKDDKGNVIVSYDNWKTNQPVKRPLTAGR